MTAWERIAWIGSWIAPLGWLAAALLFGASILAPQRAVLGEGQLYAWASGLVAVALAAHVLVTAHGTMSPTFTRQERAELRFKLGLAGRYGHWRRLMRQHQRSWHRGRSHSGARPRYD